MKQMIIQTMPAILTQAVQRLTYVVLVAALGVLVSCGGDSGQENQRNIPDEEDSGNDDIVYNGPVASTDDVLAFKLAVWDNLAGDDRCGACHNEIVGQEPQFLRRDDINLAYSIALNYVDLQAPVLSRLVERAEAGHNIWSEAAPDIIENYIQNWATASGASENVIVLTPPEVHEVGVSKQLPVSSDAYEATIYPLVTDTDSANCVQCHSEASAQRQQPYFASANPETAYNSARTLIDLNNGANSRFVQRMQEGHNVWQDPSGAMSPTAYSVQQMTVAVNAFLELVPEPQPIDEDLLVSNAVGLLADGVIAASGGRVESDVIALYEFKEGAGSIAYDTSGVDPALDLNLSPTVEWVGSWGIRIEDNGKAQGDTASSSKLNDLIKLTGEYSVEAWVIPANVTQEESRIITYSGSTDTRNFSLNQTLYDYDFLSRSENSDANGMPQLSTPSADEILQATLQHVVATYDPIEGRQIFVNGELVAQDDDGSLAGNINDWDDTFVLAVGNEVDNARWWEGTVRLLAIHNRVLNAEQIMANFESGVGQKYYLLFGVSHLVNMPQAYVVFSVEVYDDYSYLFSSPFFISLDKDAVPAEDINIRGIRVGLNAKELPTSQAFANVNATVTAENYNAATGVPLATNPSGTLFALENGPLDDQFFLTFDAIGSNNYSRPAEPVPPVPGELDTDIQPDVGMRIFDEIFENMSTITTVPSERVGDFYRSELRRSLPASESLYGFLSSQQSAVAQLALAFCTELVSDTTLRNAYFGSAVFSGSLTSANSADVVDPLLAHMLHSSGLATQPDLDDPASGGEPPHLEIKGVRDELNRLIDGMTTNDTSTKVIAVCTAAVSSATMLLQ
ncbi:hypothetical protein TDB9533_01832 [Thalassocella blandensis]|nr:hypothetical protein TDB9533_01832 [Thalassocella blandensis]